MRVIPSGKVVSLYPPEKSMYCHGELVVAACYADAIARDFPQAATPDTTQITWPEWLDAEPTRGRGRNWYLFTHPWDWGPPAYHCMVTEWREPQTVGEQYATVNGDPWSIACPRRCVEETTLWGLCPPVYALLKETED